jgi:hypothetical protein
MITFAGKKMDKSRIQSILDNSSEEFLDRFFETLLEEINSDDEPFYKKARQLLLASLNNENADDFFIAICGWSLESLIDKC